MDWAVQFGVARVERIAIVRAVTSTSFSPGYVVDNPAVLVVDKDTGRLLTDTVVTVSSPSTSSAFVTGQVIIATSSTAVALSSNPGLINGIVITANPSNSNPVLIGSSAVTNTANGSGNGAILYAGASLPVGCANTSSVYVNGFSGDFVSYIGN